MCSDPAGGGSNAEDASRSMTAAGKGHDMICQKAVSLIVDLCTQDSPRLDHNTCEEFLFLISNQEYNHKDSGNDHSLFRFMVFLLVEWIMLLFMVFL